MVEVSFTVPVFAIMVIVLSYLAFAYVVSWITMIYMYVSDDFVSKDKLKSVVQLHYMFPIVPVLLGMILFQKVRDHFGRNHSRPVRVDIA